MAQWAQLLAAAGLITCGITTLVAVPLAVCAVLDGRRRGIQPFRAGESAVMAAVVVLSLWIGAAALLPAWYNARQGAVQRGCMGNLRSISAAARLYAQDHDGYSPPAGRWTEALQRYARTETIYQCPATRAGTGGYVENPSVAGRMAGKMSEAANTVAFFDGKPGHGVMGGLDAIAARHGRWQEPPVALFAFTDGHIKAATPEEAQAFRWEAGGTAHQGG